MTRTASVALACLLAACAAPPAGGEPGPSALGACSAYPAPPLNVGAEVHHLKTSAIVVNVLSPCTVRVKLGGGWGTLEPFTGKVVVLRVTERTTFNTAERGDQQALLRFGLKAGDVFSLSFDGRPFPDGSYPLNYMNW